MVKYPDRISEAYNGAMGKWMMEKSQERINWICSKVKGNKILDVGCSQGIGPIILARGGLDVTGIDIAVESIEYANKSLIHEDYSTRKNVRFFCGDFLQLPIKEKGYDTVIMAELLEHTDDPEAFVDKTRMCLEDNGRVIVTVPFGINDWPDHKRTYYLADIYELLSRYFIITNIEYFGKWIGFVADAMLTEGQMAVTLDLELLQREEKEFFAIERTLVDNNNNETAKRQKLEVRYQQQTEEYAERLSRLGEEKKAVELRNSEYAVLIEDLVAQNDKSVGVLLRAQKEIERLKIQNGHLNRENIEYRRKLSKITDTSYGKILLKCYKILKKIKHKLIK